MVTVLIGLKWWAEERGKDQRWQAAVDDLKLCFDHFVQETGKQTVKKRKKVT
jgi:hypothetical protein